jgi:hypothetical protein
VRLERRGGLFTLFVAPRGGAFQPVGTAKVALGDPVYAGIAVSSHDAKVAETAVFSGVALKEGS